MMNKIIFKKAKYIISATDGIQNGIHENTNNKNLITIFNGFHTFLTDSRTEKHEKFSVCFHGILANMQDIESLASLIKSFDENETIDFYIIGYGPKEGLIKKLKAKKNVFFLGKLSHKDTKDIREMKNLEKWELKKKHSSTWKLNGLSSLNYSLLKLINKNYYKIIKVKI